MITCEVSIGEVLDKISILKIKRKKIHDSSKLNNINFELSSLLSKLCELGINKNESLPYVNKLITINEKLWEIIDEIKLKEKDQNFDERFVELARLTYKTNDERFFVKYEINKKFNSKIFEEKNI